jgi:putative cell wall-binding protein
MRNSLFVFGATLLLATGLANNLSPSKAAAAEPAGEIVIVGGSGVVSDGLADHLASCTSGTVERVAGSDRYETATAIAAHWDTADTVFLATGLNFPDAIAAGPVAAINDAPLLLTKTNAIPSTTNRALARLAPSTVVLLGGTAAISTAVEDDLRARFPEVTRLGGSDRFGTAAALSAWHFTSGAAKVYIATGANYLDALVAGPRAAESDAPLLLVTKDRVPPATRDELIRLGPAEIVIVGSEGVVGAEVAAELAGYSSGTVTRIAGGSRFSTATAVAEGAAGTRTYIVTADDFPDGLAATPLTGGAPILLVEVARLHDVTAAAIGARTGSACEGWTPPYPAFGTGKRIIYSNSGQQIWLINEDETLHDTYLVTGREGIPPPGTYHVFSKSVNAWAPYGGITMKHMVRFVPPYTIIKPWDGKLNQWSYGFHSIPRWPDGTPLTTVLGRFGSGGCVRQDDAKAEALYAWTPIGTPVIVLP